MGLLLPVQRGQNIDVTLVEGGWSQVLHQFNRYLLEHLLCAVTVLGSGDTALKRQQTLPRGALILVALLDLTTPVHLEMG